MAKRKARKAPIANLPRSVSVFTNTSGAGKKYWRVRLGKRYTGGSVILQDFETLAEVKEWLFGPEVKELKSRPGSVFNLKATAGPVAFILTPAQLNDAANALRLLKDTEYTLSSAAEYVVAIAAPPAGVLSMKEAIAKALKAKSYGRPAYTGSIKSQWRRLMDWLPAKKRKAINTVTNHDIRKFLADCDLKPDGTKNLLRDLHVLFSWAAKHHHIRTNPCKEIPVDTGIVEERAVRIPSIPEAKHLLETALKKNELEMKIGKGRKTKVTLEAGEFIPWLVCSLFAGLRPAEASRLCWEEIDLFHPENPNIDLPAKKAKGRSRRVIPLEPVAVEWLTRYRPLNGTEKIIPNFHRKYRVFKKAIDVEPWPQDWLRHGYGSYHLAKSRNSGDTAENMGHRSTHQLFTRYRKVVKNKEDINAFWELKPSIFEKK